MRACELYYIRFIEWVTCPGRDGPLLLPILFVLDLERGNLDANQRVITITEAANASASICHKPSQNMQGETAAIFAVMLAASVIFVAVRLYVRLFMQSEPTMGVDDWSITTALVLWTSFSLIILIGAIPEGLGRDQWELTVRNVEMLAFYIWIGQVLYCLANTLVKLGFLFFYLRIFEEKNARRLLLATVGVVVCYALAFTVVDIFLCHPVSYFWTQWTDTDSHGTCLHYMQPVWVFSGIGIFLDLFIMAIPLFQLRKLKMSLKKKASVGLMFCVGILYVFHSLVHLFGGRVSITVSMLTCPLPFS